MDPRYFVTLHELKNGELETKTFPFGRFHSLESATNAAKRKYNYDGNWAVDVRQESNREARLYKIERFFMRSMRIAFASFAVGITLIFVTFGMTKIGSIPISQLTLDQIFSNLWRAVLSVMVALVSWEIAFGPGPDAR